MTIRFRKEKYIHQRQLKSGQWEFQVIIRKKGQTLVESFNESDYGTAKIAFDSAVRYRDRKLNDFAQDKVNPFVSLTLEEVFDQMQEDSVSSNETKRKDRLNFNKRIPCHKTKLVDITPAIIQKSLNDCVYDSDDVIGRVMYLWRKIYDYAILSGYVNADFTRMVKIPRSKKIVIKRPVLFEGELDLDDLNKIKNVYDRELLKMAILVLKYTGARPGEVFALSRSDISDDRISINKELGDNRHTPVLRPCKTPESVRVIPVSAKLKPVLERLLKASESDQLFTLSDGSLMSSKWAGDRVGRYMKGFNLYMLRHRASTIWDENKVSLRTIDELMGHKSSSMSTDYARSNWSLKAEAVELL